MPNQEDIQGYFGAERRDASGSDYLGPERRVRDAAFEQAVMEAAAEAAQRVSRIHRVRLVTQAAIASFAAAALIMAGIGLLYKNSAHTGAVALSRYNCRLVQTLSRTTRDFIETEANLRAVPQSAVEARIIADFAKTIPPADLQASINEQNFNNAWTVKRWRNIDEKQLAGLATNCTASLR